MLHLQFLELYLKNIMTKVYFWSYSKKKSGYIKIFRDLKKIDISYIRLNLTSTTKLTLRTLAWYIFSPLVI